MLYKLFDVLGQVLVEAPLNFIDRSLKGTSLHNYRKEHDISLKYYLGEYKPDNSPSKGVLGGFMFIEAFVYVDNKLYVNIDSGFYSEQLTNDYILVWGYPNMLWIDSNNLPRITENFKSDKSNYVEIKTL